MDEKLDAALDLLRRLDPKEIGKNVVSLIQLAPDIQETLLESVDQPLDTRLCPETLKEYLLCDFNRDGDSYRSPWSNKYDPPYGDGNSPSEEVRKIELALNESFDTYKHLYYETGVSSAYLWDTGNDFSGVVLLKKEISPGKDDGRWDSIHVFEMSSRARTASYRLTSTVILNMRTKSTIDLDLSGNMTRQSQADLPIEGEMSHVHNIGRMVEEAEGKMRNVLHEVYFGKTKDVVNDIRSEQTLSSIATTKKQQQEMLDRMAGVRG